MRATTFVRTSFAAALLAGATLTAACAVEDDSIDDTVAEETELDSDAVESTTIDKAAGSITLDVHFSHCNGITPWFEGNMSSAGAGATYEIWMSTTGGAPWTRIHSGGRTDLWPVTGKRWYKARACKNGCGPYTASQPEAKHVCEPGDVPL